MDTDSSWDIKKGLERLEKTVMSKADVKTLERVEFKLKKMQIEVLIGIMEQLNHIRHNLEKEP